jgi:hypothetical protein
MSGLRGGAGLLALGLLVVASGLARAERTGGFRTEGQRVSGTRPDIVVPYLTTGNSAFFNNSVAPRIFASPVVSDPYNPQGRPVFNLPFYGAVMSFGDRSNGAVSRPRERSR